MRRDDERMLVGILAGGLGTRLSEYTDVRPKPMVEIGGQPLLWHLMKCYAHAGFTQFGIALGYRGDIVKDFFLHYRQRSSNLTVQLGSGDVSVGDGSGEDWTVHLVDTGLEAQTGHRVSELMALAGDTTSMLTYGDALASVDLAGLLDFHRSHGRLATVTAVRPPARFGELQFDGDRVKQFAEKPQTSVGWINGGFFVLEPGVADFIPHGTDVVWEHEPLERLASDGELMAYRHDGFWHPMDTLRDVRALEELWSSGAPPWKVWD
jgi:glucose-1-phosphate cytidylyltransferase